MATYKVWLLASIPYYVNAKDVEAAKKEYYTRLDYDSIGKPEEFILGDIEDVEEVDREEDT